MLTCTMKSTPDMPAHACAEVCQLHAVSRNKPEGCQHAMSAPRFVMHAISHAKKLAEAYQHRSRLQCTAHSG